MDIESWGTAGHAAPSYGGDSTSNISSRWPTKDAFPRGKTRKSRRRSAQKLDGVQLSLDLESVTGTSVVESSEPVVESPNSETLQQNLPDSVTLQQTGEIMTTTGNSPNEQSPAAKTLSYIDDCRKRDRAKGWVFWQDRFYDCSGRQRSRSVKLGQPIPENCYGPYATYCWYRPGRRNGEKYLGSPNSPNYKKFLAAWDSRSSADEIRARVFGPHP